MPDYYFCDGCRVLFSDPDELMVLRVHVIGTSDSSIFGQTASWNPDYRALCKECFEVETKK